MELDPEAEKQARVEARRQRVYERAAAHARAGAYTQLFAGA